MTEMVLESDTFTERLCACGCGEPLKPESKRDYIYGHKGRAEEDRIPDDPEPSEEAKTRPMVRVTVKVRKEMQDSVEAYLLMASGFWEMSDPICGAVATQQASAIAEKIVPLLARNQAFVRFFRSSSSFKDGMDFFMVIWPLVKIVGQHHFFHTVGQGPQQQDFVDLNGFVAP